MFSKKLCCCYHLSVVFLHVMVIVIKRSFKYSWSWYKFGPRMFAEFHSNPSGSCEDISAWTKVMVRAPRNSHEGVKHSGTSPQGCTSVSLHWSLLYDFLPVINCGSHTINTCLNGEASLCIISKRLWLSYTARSAKRTAFEVRILWKKRRYKKKGRTDEENRKRAEFLVFVLVC